MTFRRETHRVYLINGMCCTFEVTGEIKEDLTETIKKRIQHIEETYHSKAVNLKRLSVR